VALEVAGAPVRTRDGSAEVQIRAEGRGSRRLVARYAGDQRFDAGYAEARYVVEVPVAVTLTARGGESFRRGDTVALAGAVRDADGPLALATIELRAVGRTVAVAQADGSGRFTANLATAGFAAGRVQILAVFRPAAAWHAETRSAPLQISLRLPEPPPLGLFALPALVTACALGSRRLARWLRAHGSWASARTVPPPAEAPTSGRGGLRPSARRTARAMDFGVDGRIVDARNGRPLASARLRLDGARQPVSPTGGFRFEAAGGIHSVVVEANGYLAERFEINLPHGGQLREVRVDVVPIRLFVVNEFRAAATPLCADPTLLDVRTPRELAPLGGPTLGELAALVEATSYSGRDPAPEQAERASRLRAQLIGAKT
jgi:hypothetical protein